MKGRAFWASSVIICAACFFAGWLVRAAVENPGQPLLPLRLSGYEFISPLLACNSANVFPQASNINSAIQSVINKHTAAKDITSASTYFADFSTGKWSVVNGNDKYYPSSLGKVPIMIAYYELAEESSTLLHEQILYPAGSPDLNAAQEIKPEKAIVPSETYSVEELIDYMISYSDNNAAELLYEHIDQSNLSNIYGDLQIPVNNTVTSSTLDFMTPRQYAVLFRTLYNATYLTRDASQQALKTLAGTSFTQGIVAGVPNPTVVAHKFGIVSFYSGTAVTSRELHDCGIVYAPGHSYLLCVMTRGSSALSTMEQTISDISQAVYQETEKGY